MIDLTENPGGPSGDTANGVACLIHERECDVPLSGQDILDTTSYPYQDHGRQRESTSDSAAASITSSNSIVSLPIYDDGAPLIVTGNQATSVTIVGFLQVFINRSTHDGSLNVTVLNVAGCGNGTCDSH